MKLRPLAVLLAFVIALSACDNGSASDGDELVVVSTTSIWSDVVANVVGDDANVITLIANGADPHEYSPGSQDAATLAGADLIVANGLGLEESLDDLLEAVEAEGGNVLRIADHVETVDQDPHVWMDPLRVADAVDAIAAALEATRPGAWTERAAQYVSQLEQAHEDIESLIEEIPSAQRVMLTNHEALTYYADRYEIEIVGVIIPGGSTLAEPSSADLGELVELMQTRDIKVIFGETSEPDTLAQSLAAELGPDAEVVELHTEALGEPGSDADSLIKMLVTNAQLISAALTG